MIPNGASAYRRTQVQTAQPAQIVVQLYDGAIRFTDRAVQALERGEIEGSHVALIRAQAIIAELAGTVRQDAGPIAPSLMAMYDLLHRKLVRANVQKDPVPAREVLGYLRELLPAWEFAAQQALAGHPTAAADRRLADPDNLVSGGTPR